MKTLFLKNGMPVATAILAIAGAFATTSMQNASKAFTPIVGYTLTAQGQCNIAVPCDDIPSEFICRINGSDTGAPAFGKNPQGACTRALWKIPL